MAPNNPLPTWGNEKTMNLNPLILTNIQSSPYFKVNLFELKTYHEVIDEIYYKVSHLEPWEKGSRKTAGQTGMCGGVRGVGAGGIVSSAYCLLYKLFTLKLTRKQVIGLITHADSPYIRGLGFMYIRYTQPPADLWDWYDEYLDDEEEVDVKAGGGHFMTIGEMLRQWLVKLEWYSTLFPRIPVPIQKDIEMKLRNKPPARPGGSRAVPEEEEPEHIPDDEVSFGEAERASKSIARGPRHSPVREDFRASSSRELSRRSPPRRRSPGEDFARELEREHERQRKERERERERSKRDSPGREKYRSRSQERRQPRSSDKVSSGRDNDRKTNNNDARPASNSDGYHRSYSPDHRAASSQDRRASPSGESRHGSRQGDRDRDGYDRYERHSRKELSRGSDRQESGRRDQGYSSSRHEGSSSHKHSHSGRDSHKSRKHKHKERSDSYR